MSNFKVLTPHAAVIVWNYADRIGTEKLTNLNGVEETIISTLSCVSIQTTKSKSNPAGSFELVLAPFKNWISTITSGSWCAILMSNKKITEASLKKADPSMVKMVGKIETVRCETRQVGDQRQTRYLVSGTDWGHIFNNILYVENLLAAVNEPRLQGNSAAVALRKALFGEGKTPQSFAVKDNLRSLLNIFGNNLDGFTEAGQDINRLAKSTYDFMMPKEMVDFFEFVGPNNKSNKENIITRVINLKTGRLIGQDKYDNHPDSYGFIDPFSLQGTNTFWQVLLDNSNPVLNEMFNEIQWTTDGRPMLTLYNRIKPFSFRSTSGSGFSTVSKDMPADIASLIQTGNEMNALRSMFQNVKTHVIEDITVMSVNAGTNWRDKYNFIEIKPQFPDFEIIANWSKQKTQQADQDAFNREGFRPLIVGTKQFPVSPESGKFNPDQLKAWALLMREWYFDTHRLLNGTIVITGTNEYIAVGNNIRFDAGLINPTPNINKASNNAKKNKYILAHVENVSHSFTIDDEGARTFVTTIQFVRGIVVNQNNQLFGEGKLDKYPDDVLPSSDRNRVNVVSSSEDDDPDPQKQHGT